MNDLELELQQMRHQMSTLKDMLQGQQILNDRLIRHAVKKDMSSINRRYTILIALALLMIPYSYWAFVEWSGYSLWLWIVTAVFMLVCAAATYYNGKDVRDSSLMIDDLLMTRKKMARAKRFENRWLFFGIPMLIVWLGCFAFEIYRNSGGEELKALLIGGGVGAVVGALIGLKIHFKTQRQYQDIIDQIEDFTAGQDLPKADL